MVFSKTYEQQNFVTLLCDFSGTKTIRKTINWIFLTFVKVVEVFRSSSSLNVKTQKAFHRRVSQRSVRCQPLLHRMEWWPPLNLRLTLTQSGKNRYRSVFDEWPITFLRPAPESSVKRGSSFLSFFFYLTHFRPLAHKRRRSRKKLLALVTNKNFQTFFSLFLHRGLLLLLLQLPLDLAGCSTAV